MNRLFAFTAAALFTLSAACGEKNNDTPDNTDNDHDLNANHENHDNHQHHDDHDHNSNNVDNHDQPIDDACDHMEHGPVVAIEAKAPDAGGALSYIEDHKRFDVTTKAGEVGRIAIAIGDLYPTHFYFDQEVEMTAATEDGPTPLDVSKCGEVAFGVEYDLGAGLHILEVTAPSDKFSVVVVRMQQ